MTCKQRQSINYKYYKSGELEAKFVIKNNTPDDYMAYFYYKNGNLREVSNYVDGKLTGKFSSFYPNGGKKSVIHFLRGTKNGKMYRYDELGKLTEIQTYRNDSLHGLVQKYNKAQDIIKEYLFINGSKKLMRMFFANDDKSIVKMVNYNVLLNDNKIENGQLVKNTVNGSYYDDLCFYYDVINKDTVESLDEELRINLKFVNKYSWFLELQIGNLNDELKFVGDKQIIIGEKNNVEFNIRPEKVGDNLLLGKLYVTQDEGQENDNEQEKFEFLFFYEYYVNGKISEAPPDARSLHE